MPVRDPVQPVDQLVHHLGERLDQRDARVADVVVGPVGRALLDQALGVVDQVLEVAVVEVRGGQDHVSSRPSATSRLVLRNHVEGEDEVARVVRAADAVGDVDVEHAGVGARRT